jgi:hypothetical protein
MCVCVQGFPYPLGFVGTTLCWMGIREGFICFIGCETLRINLKMTYLKKKYTHQQFPVCMQYDFCRLNAYTFRRSFAHPKNY